MVLGSVDASSRNGNKSSENCLRGTPANSYGRENISYLYFHT